MNAKGNVIYLGFWLGLSYRHLSRINLADMRDDCDSDVAGFDFLNFTSDAGAALGAFNFDLKLQGVVSRVPFAVFIRLRSVAVALAHINTLLGAIPFAT